MNRTSVRPDGVLEPFLMFHYSTDEEIDAEIARLTGRSTGTDG